MFKQVICTEKAPPAIGPYSQAIKSGGFLFASGQIPIDPSTGQIVDGGIEEQTKQVLENVLGLLESAGMSLENVVKTTLFITNMDEFPIINSIYSNYFKQSPPARSCVEVSALPKGVKIEIEFIASLSG
ncbi:MAG TPA: RidA family protein [Tepidanaerobacteraceae bacterium]|jgi:2-iminobutanoate/2-iminopropanoate deaminase|nr:RidA family protein [Tepidanaerobacteraceae bacterium]